MAAAAESARAVFAELGDERGLAYSERALAQVRWFGCRASAALEAFERARVHAETAGLPYLVDECLTLQALMLFNGPVPTREATVQCERLLESARGRVHAQAAISLSLGALLGMRGEIRRARELVRPAAATLREMGLPSTCQISYVFVADVEEHAHDLDAAERLLREGLEELDRLDDRAWSSTVSMLLAHLLARQGRDEEAQAMLQVAREWSSPDDIINIAGLGALEGLLLARRGGYIEAERLAKAAVATAETTDMPWVRGTAAEHLAAVLELADRRDEARSELERALKIYEARGDAPHSRRLREELAGLT
jgi:tetratricopeptide (TPR) repeat protein